MSRIQNNNESCRCTSCISCNFRICRLCINRIINHLSNTVFLVNRSILCNCRKRYIRITYIRIFFCLLTFDNCIRICLTDLIHCEFSFDSALGKIQRIFCPVHSICNVFYAISSCPRIIFIRHFKNRC